MKPILIIIGSERKNLKLKSCKKDIHSSVLMMIMIEKKNDYDDEEIGMRME